MEKGRKEEEKEKELEGVKVEGISLLNNRSANTR